MTIHPEHPFLPPTSERDPVRRLRGRLGGAVSLWTTGDGADRAGLTVSSVLVAPGDPAHVIGLLDPDSELAVALETTGTVVVQLLRWEHRQLADAFAGQFPAPGGVFRLGEELGGWVETLWGPRLATAPTWLGATLVEQPPADVGWARLYDARVDHVELGADDDPLEHRRGRYSHPAP
jgi:flavin reductase (DIM6/NTAB) family NADH-FMN oxidoreductase RutF